MVDNYDDTCLSMEDLTVACQMAVKVAHDRGAASGPQPLGHLQRVSFHPIVLGILSWQYRTRHLILTLGWCPVCLRLTLRKGCPYFCGYAALE